MKTAEAWARRMKKVTDRARAKICLSILLPPPLPLSLPLPLFHFPLVLSFSSSNSALFFLLALFALLPSLRSLVSLPSPHRNCLHRRDANTRDRETGRPIFPTTHPRFRFRCCSGEGEKEIDIFASSIVRGEKRFRETIDVSTTRLEKKRKKKSIEMEKQRRAIQRENVLSCVCVCVCDRARDRERNGSTEANRRGERASHWRCARSGAAFKTGTCRDFRSTRRRPWKVCPAAPVPRNHRGAGT